MESSNERPLPPTRKRVPPPIPPRRASELNLIQKKSPPPLHPTHSSGTLLLLSSSDVPLVPSASATTMAQLASSAPPRDAVHANPILDSRNVDSMGSEGPTLANPVQGSGPQDNEGIGNSAQDLQNSEQHAPVRDGKRATEKRASDESQREANTAKEKEQEQCDKISLPFKGESKEEGQVKMASQIESHSSADHRAAAESPKQAAITSSVAVGPGGSVNDGPTEEDKSRESVNTLYQRPLNVVNDDEADLGKKSNNNNGQIECNHDRDPKASSQNESLEEYHQLPNDENKVQDVTKQTKNGNHEYQMKGTRQGSNNHATENAQTNNDAKQIISKSESIIEVIENSKSASSVRPSSSSSSSSSTTASRSSNDLSKASNDSCSPSKGICLDLDPIQTTDPQSSPKSVSDGPHPKTDLEHDIDIRNHRSTQTTINNNLVLTGSCNHFFWIEKMGSQGQSWQKDAADQNFDYMFKLLIIGNSSVGKTSFLFRYADDSFTSAFVSTVGIDFKVKTVFRQDKRVKLQIWDTAGQERYRTITTAYYRGAMGFILMYDVTNEESFSSVHDWCTQIKTYSWDNAQVILVGNKCDMEDERVISFERGKQLADSLGLEFYETSAKENINVRTCEVIVSAGGC
ncbi:hypothetical protein TCAL_14604 [Tigriopus californicus]|uniref:small monomeric GTPase n=1 Tax=Tigriopus californicus TaxID=6832 RepID=A0A553PDC4_TIGCA|nr:hypothetical protein TCAL_14604 [Tigriopus californicus]